MIFTEGPFFVLFLLTVLVFLVASPRQRKLTPHRRELDLLRLVGLALHRVALDVFPRRLRLCVARRSTKYPARARGRTDGGRRDERVRESGDSLLLQVPRLRGRESQLHLHGVGTQLRLAGAGDHSSGGNLLLHLPVDELHDRRVSRGAGSQYELHRRAALRVLLPAARRGPDRARFPAPAPGRGRSGIALGSTALRIDPLHGRLLQEAHHRRQCGPDRQSRLRE